MLVFQNIAETVTVGILPGVIVQRIEAVYNLPGVGHSVVVVIRVLVVADSVPVAVKPLIRIIGEGILLIGYAVPVVVDSLVRIIR